jgi:TIR domain
VLALKTFISHSGARSRALAVELEAFVRRLVPGSNPWISPTGIEKGTRWGIELSKNLGEASAGIVCLTPENLTENWILFEAGALSREPSDRVWTFLLDVEDAQLPSPLGQFQNTKATKTDVWLLIETMNKVIANDSRNEGDLAHLFEKLLWPDLEKRITEIRAMPLEREPARRSDHDILSEVLTTVRELAKVQERHASLEGLRVALSENMKVADSGPMSWQPQYANTPLPLRMAAAAQQTTVVEPIMPPPGKPERTE